MVVGVPILVLALVESLLWLFDVAPPPEPTTAREPQPAIIEAGWRPDAAHAGYTKVPETGWLSCFGGSSMAGAPLERELTICHMVGEALSPAPMVVNTASSALDSQDVRVIADVSCQYPHRLMLLYSGHNEFLNLKHFVRGKPPEALIEASRFLEHFRFYRGIQSLVASDPKLPAEAGEPEISNEEVYARYESNLREILSACKDRPLLIGKMISNQALRYPRELSVREAHRRGKLRPVPLHETCRECFRAPQIINLIIERVASEYGMPVVDMPKLVEGRDHWELFWDHVHPKPALLREMAAAFLAKAKEVGYIDDYAPPDFTIDPERLRWAAADRAFYNLRFDPELALAWLRESAGYYAPAQEAIALLTAGFLLDRSEVVREGVAKANEAIRGDEGVRERLAECLEKGPPLPCVNLDARLLMNDDERADLLRQAREAGADPLLLRLLEVY